MALRVGFRLFISFPLACESQTRGPGKEKRRDLAGPPLGLSCVLCLRQPADQIRRRRSSPSAPSAPRSAADGSGIVVIEKSSFW